MPTLRQTLIPPFVVEPTATPHTHTVVFLHRFPESTTPSTLPSKVLSSKRTKNHQTLQQQFPSLRWVFPYAKAGNTTPYTNLSAADKAALGLSTTTTRCPYITQILLQESQRVGGLDRIILGGQGDTAVAAHESMASFPEITPSMRAEEGGVGRFLKQTFYAEGWTDAAKDPRLAGFVGMHRAEREVTRDQALKGVAGKLGNEPARVNVSVVVNTEHLFIRGGYEVTTETWDGRRVDDFARFLEESVGVVMVGGEADGRRKKKIGWPVVVGRLKTREEKLAEKARYEADEAKKYAEMVAREKREKKVELEKIKVQIEADKVRRKMVQERERQAREAIAAARKNGKANGQVTPPRVTSPPGDFPSASGPSPRDSRSPSRGSPFDDTDSDGEGEPSQSRYKVKYSGRRLGGDVAAPSNAPVNLAQARLRASGLLKEEEEEEKAALQKPCAE
ncbi:hypothetical protein QBC34DRAFT_464312 [Podospora aff. communis PSN243]|uniref:Uncharacterized protein n=1 Tax=Podospora aff. communis PSN243 TaxID=3040156 RepID=A0AAV9GKG4_9PEZI|nr:hypothetical protein QBC34DRAFT_464312 [Podospora aff. communis PSN243]